jgi:hypothetical protein
LKYIKLITSTLGQTNFRETNRKQNEVDDDFPTEKTRNVRTMYYDGNLEQVVSEIGHWADHVVQLPVNAYF